MRDRATGEELWSVALPSVPLSAFSSSGRVVQRLRATLRQDPELGLRPLPASLLRAAREHLRPPSVRPRQPQRIFPGGDLASWQVGEVHGPSCCAGPGGALSPLGSRHRRPSPFESIACDATGQERIPGMPGLISLRDPQPAGSRFRPNARLAPGPTEDCGDACAQPPCLPPRLPGVSSPWLT